MPKGKLTQIQPKTKTDFTTECAMPRPHATCYMQHAIADHAPYPMPDFPSFWKIMILYAKYCAMTKPKTAGIILAAGESRRFGSPTQLANFRGKPLLEWVIDAVVPSELDTVLLILGHAHDEILNCLGDLLLETGIHTYINHDYRKGQSSSLHLGLSMVRGDHQASMFLLCDQPFIETYLINRFIAEFSNSTKTIGVPICSGKRGNPAIFGSEHFDELMKIEGDQGGRDLIRSKSNHVLEFEIDNPHVFRDIDTPEDLTRLSELKF